jgi:hypothetical protein
MNVWVRAGVAVLLLVVLFGTFVHYDVAQSDHAPYPAGVTLVEEYDDHIGEKTLLFGTVQSVTDDRLVIEVSSSAGTYEMTVFSGGIDVEPGGFVQVYGTLGPEYTIEPSRIEVVNRTGSSALYKYGVSAAGALLVVVLFFRYWALDTDEWVLEARFDG